VTFQPATIQPATIQPAALQDPIALGARPVPASNARRTVDVRADPAPVRWAVIGVAAGFLALFIVVPLVNVFVQAFSKGLDAYLAAIGHADAIAAVWLTLAVAAISLALNLVFGIVAAWTITKYEFRGKSLLITAIDLPFSVSPVISGLVFVLLLGAQGYFGIEPLKESIWPVVIECKCSDMGPLG